MYEVNEWVTSESDDTFNSDYYGTKEEAIIEGKDEYEGGFYVGQITEDMKDHIVVNVDYILETIADNIFDRVGEVSIGYLFDNPEGMEEELEDELVKTIKKVLKKYNSEPTYFAVDNIEYIENGEGLTND